MRKWAQRIFIYFLWFSPVVIFLLFVPVARKDFTPDKGTEFGFTFSNMYAEELGLDWKETYRAMLDDLGAKYLRIPVYWDRVEPLPDFFDWSEVDFQLDEAAQHGVKVILAVGRRLPRWPECHDPSWLPRLSQGEFERSLLSYISAAVERYKDHPSVIAWQVENEPFLEIFGECPRLDEALLDREIALVRSLDDRPLVVTESGELSTWISGGKRADILGVSIYKVTWNNFWGYFYYPIPPAFYYYKAQFIKRYTPAKDVISTELQVEPWTESPVISVPLKDQFVSMDLPRVRENISFSRKTGFSQVYLWGVEWWYWLKETQHRPEFWEYGKTLFGR